MWKICKRGFSLKRCKLKAGQILKENKIAKPASSEKSVPVKVALAVIFNILK